MLLTDAGEVKLADFGVSAQLKSPGGFASTFIGTPYWMAPEVILTDPDSPSSDNAHYDCKADIWSIGITAIEIAEKNPPLSDIHPMRALQLIPKSDIGLSKPKSFPKQFVDFVAQCLVKDPAKRPTAAQMLDHPFMGEAKALPRQKIIAEMVALVKRTKERKKAGLDDEDEDEKEKREEVPAKIIAETMHQAQQAKQQIALQGTTGSKASSQPPPTPSSETLPPASADLPPSFVNSVETPEAQVLDPIAVTSVRGEFFTSDLLDKRFLLLGAERGLYFVDLEGPPNQQPTPLIRNIRFKQIVVLTQYNVLIALSGKRDHVRQYSLTSIRRMLLYLTGEPIAVVAQMKLNVSIQEGKELLQTPSVANDEDDTYKHVMTKDMDEAALITRWTGDHIKLLATRDTRSFLVEKTSTTIYLMVLFRQDITLFEWAKEPYLKFMKLKAFWLPETPTFVQLFHDGVVAREICLGYSREMNIIDVELSKVADVNVHKDFREAASGSKSRWQSFVQIPFSRQKLDELVQNANRIQNTVSRKLAAITGPGISSRQTSAVTDRFFLGTFDRMTKVVNVGGVPMMGSGVGGWRDGVKWTEQPNEIILRPLQHVMAVGPHVIEIVDWKSAELRQRLTIDPACSVRVLNSSPGRTIFAVDRKKKGTTFFLMKESPERLTELEVATADVPAQPAPNALESKHELGAETQGNEASNAQRNQDMASRVQALTRDMSQVSTDSQQQSPSSRPSSSHSINAPPLQQQVISDQQRRTSSSSINQQQMRHSVSTGSGQQPMSPLQPSQRKRSEGTAVQMMQQQYIMDPRFIPQQQQQQYVQIHPGVDPRFIQMRGDPRMAVMPQTGVDPRYFVHQQQADPRFVYDPRMARPPQMRPSPQMMAQYDPRVGRPQVSSGSSSPAASPRPTHYPQQQQYVQYITPQQQQQMMMLQQQRMMANQQAGFVPVLQQRPINQQFLPADAPQQMRRLTPPEIANLQQQQQQMRAERSNSGSPRNSGSDASLNKQ